jgi:hypothetical protein
MWRDLRGKLHAPMAALDLRDDGSIDIEFPLSHLKRPPSMTDAPDQPSRKLAAGYVPVPTAPIIYFDFVPTYGVLSGAIQVELAARTMAPLENGRVSTNKVETGRLRCSPTAAKSLRDALDAALRMLEQPQQPPMATGTLN